MKILLLVFLVFILFLYYDLENFGFELTEFKEKGLGVFDTIYGEEEILERDLEFYFCPEDDCYYAYSKSIRMANHSLKCALYELSYSEILEDIKYIANKGVEVSIVIDFDYYKNEIVEVSKIDGINVVTDNPRGTRFDNYMHHKFCIIDDLILVTGSANLSERELLMNNNNVLVTWSKLMIENFRNEFEQLYLGSFGYNKKSGNSYNSMHLSYDEREYIISTYFCPQDPCIEFLHNYLSNAKEEILFASFVLTHDDIEDILIERSKDIRVIGIIENRMKNSLGSRSEELREHFELRFDSNPATMHHKFFLIDRRFLITGSMNPSNSGAYYNDENIIIIDSEFIGNLFYEEMRNLFENYS